MSHVICSDAQVKAEVIIAYYNINLRVEFQRTCLYAVYTFEGYEHIEKVNL